MPIHHVSAIKTYKFLFRYVPLPRSPTHPVARLNFLRFFFNFQLTNYINFRNGCCNRLSVCTIVYVYKAIETRKQFYGARSFHKPRSKAHIEFLSFRTQNSPIKSDSIQCQLTVLYFSLLTSHALNSCEIILNVIEFIDLCSCRHFRNGLRTWAG